MLLHVTTVALYLALAHNPGLRVGDLGSEGDLQRLLLVKLLASPLWALGQRVRTQVKGSSTFPPGGQWPLEFCLLSHLTQGQCTKVVSSTVLTTKPWLPGPGLQSALGRRGWGDRPG